jgi:hypothetical protein
MHLVSSICYKSDGGVGGLSRVVNWVAGGKHIPFIFFTPDCCQSPV